MLNKGGREGVKGRREVIFKDFRGRKSPGFFTFGEMRPENR